MTDAGSYEGGSSGTGMIEKTFEGTGIGRAESMDVGNDPRFFQDNVIMYRLAAFGQLGVVSGLLVQNAMSMMFDMNKNMGLIFPFNLHIDSFIQLISFVLLCFCFFMNMLATYIGVAQPYHIIRLMTSGATGFEAAASYYLNSNICLWRHFAIKSMLLSLPLFCAQMGLRLVVKFDRGTMQEADLPNSPPWHARVQGIAFCVILCLMALVLVYINNKHQKVFRDRYNTMITPAALTTHMQTMMQPRVNTANEKGMGGWYGLDV